MGKGVSDEEYLRERIGATEDGEGWTVKIGLERAKSIADRLRALDKPTEEAAERVARAIAEASEYPGENAWQVYLPHARAAIAALQDGV